MKYLLILFALFTTTALAENPSYTCNPTKDCIELVGPEYDIGRGLHLTLPDDWKFFSYPSAPIKMMASFRESRAFKNDVVIAISPLPVVDDRVITQEKLRNLLTYGLIPYVEQSKEGTINVESMSDGEIIGYFASFTAKNEADRPFAVLPNRRFSSVTSFIILYKRTFFNVSVASEHTLDEDYQIAVNAVRGVK